MNRPAKARRRASDTLQRVIGTLTRARSHTATTEQLCAELGGMTSTKLAQTLMPHVRADWLRRIDRSTWGLGAKADAGVKPAAQTLFERDTQPLRNVSAMAVPSVFAYAQDRQASAFSVALHTDGRLEIQRYGRVIAELTDVERKILILAGTTGVKSK